MNVYIINGNKTSTVATINKKNITFSETIKEYNVKRVISKISEIFLSKITIDKSPINKDKSPINKDNRLITVGDIYVFIISEFSSRACYGLACIQISNFTCRYVVYAMDYVKHSGAGMFCSYITRQQIKTEFTYNNLLKCINNLNDKFVYINDYYIQRIMNIYFKKFLEMNENYKNNQKIDNQIFKLHKEFTEIQADIQELTDILIRLQKITKLQSQDLEKIIYLIHIQKRKLEDTKIDKQSQIQKMQIKLYQNNDTLDDFDTRLFFPSQ